MRLPQPCTNYGGGAHHDSYFPRTVDPGLTRVNDTLGGSMPEHVKIGAPGSRPAPRAGLCSL
eukprot:983417-Prymnesium_polylepis.1